MAIKCKNCNHCIKGAKGLHTVSECPKCGETRREMFVRVEMKDYKPQEHKKDREWLEAHRAEKK